MKYETQKPAGLLQPLPTPSSVWKDLSLDFITGLPLSNGVSTILIVVDRFPKGVHFGTLPPNYTAYRTALLFLDIVCKLMGFPRAWCLKGIPYLSTCFGTNCSDWVVQSSAWVWCTTLRRTAKQRSWICCLNSIFVHTSMTVPLRWTAKQRS